MSNTILASLALKICEADSKAVPAGTWRPYDVALTSMRRYGARLTSERRRVTTGVVHVLKQSHYREGYKSYENMSYAKK